MTIRQKLDSYLEVALSLLLGLMVLNVLWQVASRFLLNDPSAFTDELARYLLIWVGLLGAAYATGKRMHVSIDLITRKLNEKQQAVHFRLIRFIILCFAIFVLILGGTRLVYITFILGQTSSAMQVSLGYIYLALPLSGLLICYYTICDLLNID
ncbi:TRAP-type C4-dicarboxylate transport system, small permease component [Reichenbachiella agariperforans]|uniref:TRAP-type C4-dicarboxylate transport system, small permease component n=1 Tax=Reichenbachiella agariperforans TaxID=156994 RepID=A0A1M6QE80_REIAG|nr:TRAP transporter small permease [Reichenbachiella agariperforans]SHK18542.1 TRAP-type C4-dicarboxylate transport system, small permease component [Reichenbachiella agariperforans]